MLAAARVAASQDRKSLAAAYLLQSELALLRKENRLGLKAAMRSRDLSRKTQTKKGEARQVLPSLPLPATSTVLPVCPLDPREREREREREGERERGKKEGERLFCACVALAFRPLPCCSSALPTVPEASSSEATLLLSSATLLCSFLGFLLCVSRCRSDRRVAANLQLRGRPRR